MAGGLGLAGWQSIGHWQLAAWLLVWGLEIGSWGLVAVGSWAKAWLAGGLRLGLAGLGLAGLGLAGLGLAGLGVCLAGWLAGWVSGWLAGWLVWSWADWGWLAGAGDEKPLISDWGAGDSGPGTDWLGAGD